MQALYIHQHGPVSGLQPDDIPQPVPGPDEVLVEIEAAAINPSDVVSAEGRFPHAHLPRVLGRDFAGHIVDGPPELIGKAIWGAGGDLGIARDGTHAEYVVIPQAAASIRPRNLSAEQAAAVGIPFQTAWSALIDRGNVQAGEWVIIAGAAGAVGSAAIQIAAAHQAKIIALVKNESDDARLDREKVAVIAHTDSNDLAGIVERATGGKGAELAINAVGGTVFQPLIDALRSEGRMVFLSVMAGREVTLDLLQLYRRNLTLHGLNTEIVDTIRGAKILDQLAPLFESGAITPPQIAERYPLSRAAEAYQRVSQGKIVLIPDRKTVF